MLNLLSINFGVFQGGLDIPGAVQEVNPDIQCMKEISEISRKTCLTMNEDDRLNLAVQIMKCRYKGRESKLPRYDFDNNKFVMNLDSVSYQIFASTYSNIGSLCQQMFYQDQVKQILMSLYNLSNSVDFASQAFTSLSNAISSSNGDVKNQFVSMKITISEQTSRIYSILSQITELFETMETILNTITSFRKMAGIYLVYRDSLIAAILFQLFGFNTLQPIVFLTISWIFLVNSESMTLIEPMMSKEVYLSCVLLCILVEIAPSILQLLSHLHIVQKPKFQRLVRMYSTEQ